MHMEIESLSTKLKSKTSESDALNQQLEVQ